MKLAIIGAGPSSFYVASRLLSLAPPGSPLGKRMRIHVYDRNWAPHGLVRYGVAPDHPEVKNCTHKFDVTAQDPRLRFFGNVNVKLDTQAPFSPSQPRHALDLSLAALAKHYTHLVLATGCPLPRTHPRLNHSGHNLTTALDMVHWYTRHPTSRYDPELHKRKHVTLIGNGNVSLDVARMLLTPVSKLSPYDVPSSVLEHLRNSTVKHVSIIARRGLADVAFTAKELRELLHLRESGVHLNPIPPQLFEEARARDGLPRQTKRILDLLEKGSKESALTQSAGDKSWSLDFYREPNGISSSEPDSDGMVDLDLVHTKPDPLNPGGILYDQTTSPHRTSLVVQSLGFIPETTVLRQEGDENGKEIKSQGGRMSLDGKIIDRAYMSGWASTGSKGVLASTMMDAYSVASTILADLDSQDPNTGVFSDAAMTLGLSAEPIEPSNPPPEVTQAIQRGQVLQYNDWKVIDEEEVAVGQTANTPKERERVDWEGAIEILAKHKQK